jgi:hypothetical protein
MNITLTHICKSSLYLSLYRLEINKSTGVGPVSGDTGPVIVGPPPKPRFGTDRPGPGPGPGETGFGFARQETTHSDEEDVWYKGSGDDTMYTVMVIRKLGENCIQTNRDFGNLFSSFFVSLESYQTTVVKNLLLKKMLLMSSRLLM